MAKQYQILCLGGPADGKRILYREKPKQFITVTVYGMPKINPLDGNYINTIPHEVYRVYKLHGNKSQYFIATQGNPSGDEIIEALLKGYNRRETSV